MTTIFQALAEFLANLLTIDVGSAGFILGAILVFTIFLTILILSSVMKNADQRPSLIAMAFGMVLSVGFQWWDPWTLVLPALVLAFLILNPWGTRSSGGI
jgi:hypothetical protein